MTSTVAVVIPSLPKRHKLLLRALESVKRQRRQPDQLIVALDTKGKGAAHTRNKALSLVETDFVAFLDDDDELLPNHLKVLMDAQAASGADLVYPWFEVVGGCDPLGAESKLFDPEALRQANFIPVTTLCRTSAVRAAGGFRNINDQPPTLEDWNCWIAMLDQGSKFMHLPLRTWIWHREPKTEESLVSFGRKR